MFWQGLGGGGSSSSGGKDSGADAKRSWISTRLPEDDAEKNSFHQNSIDLPESG